MKGKVIFYEKRQDIIESFKPFFRKKRLNAVFVRDEDELRRELSDNRRAAACLLIDIELIKRKRLKADIPSIAIISKDMKKGIEKASRSGVDDYLTLPLNPLELDYKLNRLFKKDRLFSALKRETDDLQTLIELNQLLTSTLDPQEILFLIVKKISEIISVTRCSIVRIDSDTRYGYVVSTFEDPNLRNIKLDLRRYPEIRKALISKSPVIVKNVASDPLMKQVRDIIFPLGIRSIMVIPIVFREEVIGTLFIRTSRAGYSFSSREIKLCHAIANASANALYNAFIFEMIEDEKTRLERLAITDYLTGLYNIRYFYHRLEEEFSRAKRYNFPLSCLMIDIDHFKEINDRYGHRAGDSVLKEVARLMKNHTRKSDVLARYGGEEFIMLLPETSEKGAIIKAESLRTSISKLRFNALKDKRTVTVSIGVATYPDVAVTETDDLISYADNALYEAKRSGRDMVKVFKET
jgi:two-component system cell cycle response regulator